MKAGVWQVVRRAGTNWDAKAVTYGVPIGMLTGLGCGYKLANDDFKYHYVAPTFYDRVFQRTLFGMGGAVLGGFGGGILFYLSPFWVPVTTTAFLYELATSGK